MLIQFIVGKEVKYSVRTNYTREELLGHTNTLYKNNFNKTGYPNNTKDDNKQKFKIPLNKSENALAKKRGRSNFQEEDDFSESSYTSDSFDLAEDEVEEVGGEYTTPDMLSEDNKKHLRKYKSEMENFDSEITSLKSNKKQKRELTEDDIVKRNDQILKRKLHAKRVLEEEKKQTIEKILNEDGRKLKERQRKLNEDVIKKEQLAEENYKVSLTKIKLKHDKNGSIYLRFPQGLMLPKILMQKSNTTEKYPEQPMCNVLNCKNLKKYKDPVTKKNYCSVECYKIIKNTMHVC